MTTITLARGREVSLRRRHPWIFSGAVARVEAGADGGEVVSGATVAVRAADGTPLGWGAYSPHSQIAIRMWTFSPAEEVTPEFVRRRLRGAVAARLPLAMRADLNSYRLVHAESDGLPGVVIDRYGDYLVCQFLSAGAEYWRGEIVAALMELAARMDAGLVRVRGIYERSDVDVRQKEGLPPRAGPLAGEAPPDEVLIQEYGCQFAVQIQRGHKTGFYLDQRDNRARLADYADRRDVLNAFAYSGGFAVWALRAGARHVTNVETSGQALALAARNAALNGFEPGQMTNIEGDVFHVLRQYRDAGRQFDVIVLDPPKFAESRAQVESAARGYKDINLLACKLLRPGGHLFTFSCSGLIEPSLFQKIVAAAALDSGREVRIEHWLHAGPDHPVALSFPEGEYLKGMICRVE